MVLSKKIPMQANLHSHTGSSIKNSSRSGVRFSVRFPVFVIWSYWKKSYVGKFLLSSWFIFKEVRGPVFCPVSGYAVVSKYFLYRKISFVLLIYHDNPNITISSLNDISPPPPSPAKPPQRCAEEKGCTAKANQYRKL